MERLDELNLKMAKQEGIVDPEEVSFEIARQEIKNPDNFAKRIETSETEITPGVVLFKKTIELGDGHFTNAYDLSFNNKDPYFDTEISTRHKPIYAHRLFINNEIQTNPTESPVACINGAFFFLQDEQLTKEPSEIIYNLNIRDEAVVGLPAANRPALFVTKDGHIHAKELEAKGILEIGSKKIEWIGGEVFAHGKKENDMKHVVLYNSACCTIQYENPEDKTSLRKIRKDLNLTPKSEHVTDIIITVDENQKLKVENIQKGGGTDFFEGNFILQIPTESAEHINIGDIVDPKTIDDLELAHIKSAMTTGPSVNYFREHTDHEINHDPSLGTFPPFAAGVRYARSVMYEDASGFTHMTVFDAVPRSSHMKGVTPKEVANLIPQDSKWAVFLDGGQSSRITFTKDGQIDACGNNQYVRLHKLDKTSQSGGVDDRFLWTKRGRPINSMIILNKKLS